MEIVEIKCDGCGTMRKWRGYECLTFCDCLADKPEDESNLLVGQMKKLWEKLKNKEPLTKAEREYMRFIKNRNGEKDDYLYQEALEDMKQLDKIDPPDEENK